MIISFILNIFKLLIPVSLHFIYYFIFWILIDFVEWVAAVLERQNLDLYVVIVRSSLGPLFLLNNSLGQAAHHKCASSRTRSQSGTFPGTVYSAGSGKMFVIAMGVNALQGS